MMVVLVRRGATLTWVLGELHQLVNYFNAFACIVEDSIQGLLLFIGGPLILLKLSILVIASTKVRLLLLLANKVDGFAVFIWILRRDWISYLKLIYNYNFRLIGGYSEVILNLGLRMRLQDLLNDDWLICVHVEEGWMSWPQGVGLIEDANHDRNCHARLRFKLRADAAEDSVHIIL